MKEVWHDLSVYCHHCKSAHVLTGDTNNCICPRCQHAIASLPGAIQSRELRIGSNNWLIRAIYSYCSVTRQNQKLLLRYLATFSKPTILVVGGATVSFGLEDLSRIYANRIVSIDIYASAYTDIIADAHQLPFPDCSFDLIIATSVLEHLERPWLASEEIIRVLKPGGLVYSEVPFLQSIHEPSSDFYRFTLQAHKDLFNPLSEVRSGISKGFFVLALWFFRDTFMFIYPLNKFLFVVLYPPFYVLDSLFSPIWCMAYSESYYIARKECRI